MIVPIPEMATRSRFGPCQSQIMETEMTRTYLAAMVLLGAAATAQAGELVPYGGETIALGSFRGNAYYVDAQGGYRVVATLAEGEAGLPLRFEATLADHQSVTISVPGEPGQQSKVLEIWRTGDKLITSNPLPTD
jgi:hypothetical protein